MSEIGVEGLGVLEERISELSVRRRTLGWCSRTSRGLAGMLANEAGISWSAILRNCWRSCEARTRRPSATSSSIRRVRRALDVQLQCVLLQPRSDCLDLDLCLRFCRSGASPSRRRASLGPEGYAVPGLDDSGLPGLRPAAKYRTRYERCTAASEKRRVNHPSGELLPILSLALRSRPLF